LFDGCGRRRCDGGPAIGARFLFAWFAGRTGLAGSERLAWLRCRLLWRFRAPVAASGTAAAHGPFAAVGRRQQPALLHLLRDESGGFRLLAGAFLVITAVRASLPPFGIRMLAAATD
jgi:hypothetical protein